MQEATTRTTASVGSSMIGSGTFSTRTSPAAYINVARMLVPWLLSGWSFGVTAGSGCALRRDTAGPGDHGDDGRDAVREQLASVRGGVPGDRCDGHEDGQAERAAELVGDVDHAGGGAGVVVVHADDAGR